MNFWIAMTLGLITAVQPSALNCHAAELTDAAARPLYGFWLKNPRAVAPDQDGYRYAITTDQYALVLNVARGGIERLGVTPETATAQLLESNGAWLAKLPEPGLKPWIELNGQRFEIQGALNPALEPEKLYQSMRLIDGGRYLQHVELTDLVLTDQQGQPVPGLRAWLELACWPDFVALSLHVAPSDGTIPRGALSIGLDTPTSLKDIALRPADAESTVTTSGEGQQITRHFDDATTASAGWLIVPRRTDAEAYAQSVQSLGEPDNITIQANQRDPDTARSTRFDRRLWAHMIELDSHDDHWMTERVDFSIENRSDTTLLAPLIFNKVGPNPKLSILMGFGSLVADPEHGEPLGIPMQISKNWHVRPTWSHAITMLPLRPSTRLQLQYIRPYALWGGVPAVSHSQLCLVGWGGHQLWDEVAVGSFGENICYDPNVGLQRSVVDDIRPMQVWGFEGPEAGKEQWTVNVGGADFLVIEQADGSHPEKETDENPQKPSRKHRSEILLPELARADYAKIGPVLSKVTYSSQYAAGAILSNVTTYSWRSDDFFRAVFHIRYDVRQALDFRRLAFFQLGADHYNDNLFTTLARGDADTLHEEWEPASSDWQYSRRNLPLTGDQPWLAMLGTRPDNTQFAKAAWPNRAIVVRAWQARLGGMESSEPAYSIRGTNDQMQSAQIEISPPDGLQRLEPGDYVDMWLELDIIPQKAEDYFGPNAAFRRRLAESTKPWELPQIIAREGAIRVHIQQGTQQPEYLPVIKAGEHATEFDLEGGWGYAPITITGLDRATGWVLEEQSGSTWKTLDPLPNGQFMRQADWTAGEDLYALSFTLDRPTTATTRLRLTKNRD